MRTLLAITAGAVATAALMVLCDARPGNARSAHSASAERAAPATPRPGDDSDLDALLACDCRSSAQDRFDAACFLWCPLDFDDALAGDDE